MGQEIDHTVFSKEELDQFKHNLTTETQALEDCFSKPQADDDTYVAGFELEACLVDKTSLRPAPVNGKFLGQLDSELASAELASFNIEFNTEPLPLYGSALSVFHQQLRSIITEASPIAHKLDTELLLCGILPTLKDEDLSPDNMSRMKRYQALNEQVLAARHGHPLRLDIVGHEHLVSEHYNVMLEAAATSFQLHLKTPFSKVQQAYNAAILVTAPVVAACANSPFLFGRDLWAETRIPVFEQSVQSGGYAGASQGPLHRVSYGSGYARNSILEVFRENLEHFPPLLPMVFEQPEPFAHLRLHNGTLWRWNRPLVGFNKDGTPHIRLELRSLPAGPTIKDTIANAALYFGLVRYYQDYDCQQLEFALAKDNFYQAARLGLKARLFWLDQDRHNMQDLLINELIPQAREGLVSMNLSPQDIDYYLGIMQERVASGLTGSNWQRQHCAAVSADAQQNIMYALTRDYLAAQKEGRPVHLWEPHE